MARSLALILVAYHHTEAEITHMLDQWELQSRPPDRVYVVENSPLQLSPQLTRRVRVLDPGENLGFTGGVNLAARAAYEDGCTHLLLSNLDVEILSSELVTKLAGVFSAHPDCVFASPGIVMWPDTWRIWYRGARVLRPAWITQHPHIGHRWEGSSSGAVMTGYFSGCCALVELKRFLVLGGFEESLFMYYDEADLAERARMRGWTSWLFDEPLAAHAKHDNSLSEQEAYWHARNSTALLNRHEHGIWRIAGRAAQWAIAPFQLLRCDSHNARVAYIAGFLGRVRPVRKGEP